jgi:subfamily B ATP-binding cassette protein MsbA
MNTYLRLIQFVKPITPFFIGFIVLSILHAIFSLANFVMIEPLLNVLFETVKSDPAELAKNLEAPVYTDTHLKALLQLKMQSIVAETGRFKALQFVCLIVILTSFLSNLFRYLQIRLKERLRAKMSRNTRSALFNKVLSMNVGYFNENRKGDIISKNTNDVSNVENTITSSLAVFIKEPIMIVFYFSVLFSMSASLTLVALTVVPITGGLISMVMKRLKKQATGLQESQGNLLTMIDEAISGMRVIKAFSGLGYVRNKYETENKHYTDSLKSFSYRRELASPLSEWTGIMIVSGILLYGGYLIFQGGENTLVAAEFITYLVIFSQVTRPIKALTNEYSNLRRGLAAGERVLELLDTPIEIVDAPDAKILEGFERDIEFNDVSFSYDGERDVLKSLNFKVEKGKTIALVGQSGGGKSTIADLIPRFYDSTKGEIKIDGVDVREYKMESIHAQMGVVTQESILFNDSIFNNIAFGKPNAKLEDVIHAAKIANAHDFIEATEKGYETTIGDRGAKLSGGQRQRLSIARAIFKNPPILILDEATSALDTESEKLVQDALNHLMENRTSIVIAHRLSTIQNADEIIVINEGVIAERGTHESLIGKENGIYRKLNEMQAL